MKTLLRLTIPAILLISFSFIQTSKQLAFLMNAPDKWIKTTNEEIYDNLGKFKLTKTQLDKLISDHKGSILFVSYTKYSTSEHPGLIPTIQVNIRNNNSKNFTDFFETMKKSSEGMKTYFKDFEYIDKPTKVNIDGVDAFYFSGKFTMTNGTQTIKPRSRTYAIPNGDKFFQVNFTDGDDEDCSKIFDDLVKSIKLK